MKKFLIYTEFITLGQFLKATNYISSGGEAKFFLFANDVLVNQEKRTERGKKLYSGYTVIVDKEEYLILYDKNSQT
jgi:ribosome-associated protein